MRRWSFNLVAAVSMVVCITTAGLWLRGQFDGRLFEYYGSRNLYYVGVGGGRLSVDRFDLRGGYPVPRSGPGGPSLPLWPVALLTAIALPPGCDRGGNDATIEAAARNAVTTSARHPTAARSAARSLARCSLGDTCRA